MALQIRAITTSLTVFFFMVPGIFPSQLEILSTGQTYFGTLVHRFLVSEAQAGNHIQKIPADQWRRQSPDVYNRLDTT